MNYFKSLAACALSASVSVSFAQNFDHVTIKSSPVSESIYMLEGEGGNIAVLIGGDGTLIVDDQFAPLNAKINQAIGDLTEHPVQFLLNSHWHYDHSNGNEAFGAQGALIVSQQQSRVRMASDQLLKLLKHPQAAYKEVGLPKITFKDAMSFHYNGETINIFHTGPAHTDGDMVVHFVNANVFHTGDVFVRYGLPFIDQPNGGNIEGMIAFVDQVLALADVDSKIIPGHGPLSTKKDLQAYRDLLQGITDSVTELMAQGKNLQQIIAAKPIKNFENGFIKPDDFVKIVYDSVLANR